MTVPERALELAQTGQYRGLEAIRRQLSGEGYERVDLHLAGGHIRQRLREAWKAAAG